MDDLRRREEQERLYKVAEKEKAEKDAAEEQRRREKAEARRKLEEAGEEVPPEEEEAEEEINRGGEEDILDKFAAVASLTDEEIEFEEFLAQVSFKRTTDIEGYSEVKIEMTFIPYKLTEVEQEFTLFFENQDYTEPIPILISGSCVDVPIYVENEEYNMNVLIYEQVYRQRVILHNRSQNSMKIQLFFPKDFKPYLEFNPTLGYIQGNSPFEIWLKFRPDRTILQSCAKYLVR